MSRWAELQRTKVRPGDPRPRDPRARRVVQTVVRGKRLRTLVLECGHAHSRKLFDGDAPTHLICTACPPCGGIGQRLGGQ